MIIVVKIYSIYAPCAVAFYVIRDSHSLTASYSTVVDSTLYGVFVAVLTFSNYRSVYVMPKTNKKTRNSYIPHQHYNII